MIECRHYNQHLDTVRAYIDCLYKLEECECGGLLHIVTDDQNVRDSYIKFCLQQCNEHPEREESELGKLICEELLKLTIPQRMIVCTWYGRRAVDCIMSRCDKCWAEEEDQ